MDLDKNQQQKLWDFIERNPPLYEFTAGKFVRIPPEALHLMFKVIIDTVGPPEEKPVYAAWMSKPYASLVTLDKRLIVADSAEEITGAFGTFANPLKLETMTTAEWLKGGRKR